MADIESFDPDAKPYWDAAARGELAYQRCTSCDAAVFFPRSICPACGTGNPAWHVSAGTGTVHACSVVHRAPPAYQDKAPYAVVLVDLDEGFRMMSGMVDCDPESVAIGDRVSVVFRDDADGRAVPYFVPA